ncbi:hypothetical protein SAMN06272735_0270 [Streptomyces sp. TLI_55]|uniref:hypothetical protein n=1 Tax=Streptomyces sp. TLI_55 TaxID=1938861 RepID=UPI000BCA32E9|nr:hypothetical protein [Streptomyces sp. TLI_55]SNX55839.1 hypothetical protein SAMN06272735_0270 [Streptomyces sp. TLI_55]
MHSARMLLATAAASTVLVLGAPGAHAAGSDWEDHSDSSYSKDDSSYSKDDSSYSKDDSSYGKEHDKDSGHDSPRGGMHTGGGALTAVNADGSDTAKDPRFDPETYKDKGQGKDSGSTKQEDSWSGKQDNDEWSGKQDSDGWSGREEKPSGGMHTGGGALASPAVTAGGLAVLAVAATGLYAARRKKFSESVA